MYNWSTNEEKFKEKYPEKYKIWRLEQMINYGLGEDKLDATELKKYWNKLNMDELTRKYLDFLLWPTK